MSASDEKFLTDGLASDGVVKELEEITEEGITNEKVMQMYKSWAGVYDQHLATVNVRTYGNVLNEMKRLGIKTDARVMDIACGSGKIGLDLAELGYTNLDGLDYSEEMLDLAKEKKVYTRLITVKFGADPVEGIADDTYDVCIVVGAFNLGHLEADCMEEIIRMTKPGGYNLIQITDRALSSGAGFEEKINSLVDAGKWKLLSRNHLQVYDTMKGVFFTLQVV